MNSGQARTNPDNGREADLSQGPIQTIVHILVVKERITSKRVTLPGAHAHDVMAAILVF